MSSTDNTAASADFVSLLTKHQPDLWSYIISLMPGQADSADVLQTTNIVLWTKQKDFNTGTNFRAWAFTVARFEVLAHFKKKKREGLVLLDDELLDILAEEAPSALVASDLRLAALEQCLKKLRPQDHELLEHRYKSNLGLDEFAARVDRSVSSLSVTLHRLRASLRKCVNGHMQEEGGLS